MGVRANDATLACMAALLPLGAGAAARELKRRARRFVTDQLRLRALYGVTAETPIALYDDATRARVHALVAADPEARIATTSGSTGAPKELAYPKERLRLYRKDSIRSALGFMARHRVSHPSLFVLASQKTDDSFASLVLHERKQEPPWVATLVEPSRLLAHPRIAQLIAALDAEARAQGRQPIGLTAARVLVLAAADPGLLYATNPSTLVSFFTEVSEHWTSATSLLRRLVHGDLQGDRALRGALAGVGTRGMDARLALLAGAETPLLPTAWLPSLRAYVTWDGGYVTAFLPALHRLLPLERVAHIPMYSMSTEVIETLPMLTRPSDGHGGCAFVPLAPRVLYELLPEGAADDARLLRSPLQATPGESYTLVVSDPWGLVRYQTEDLFLCVRMVEGLPDLRFVRRRGLAYSFTGEKLTGEQLTRAFAALRARNAALADDVELSCLPSQPSDGGAPRYVLLVVATSARGRARLDALDLASVSRALDEELSAHNPEWRAKRQSERLGSIEVVRTSYAAVAAALDRRTTNDEAVSQRAWESQFKLNPLTRVRYEEIAERLR